MLKRGFFVWRPPSPSSSSEHHFLGVSLRAAVFWGAQCSLRCSRCWFPVSVVVVGGGGGRYPHPLTAVRLVVGGGVVVVPGVVLVGPVCVGHRVWAEVGIAQIIQPVEPAKVGVASSTTSRHSETGIIITRSSNGSQKPTWVWFRPCHFFPKLKINTILQLYRIDLCWVACLGSVSQIILCLVSNQSCYTCVYVMDVCI